MSDFVIEVDVTAVELMSEELTRLGYGDRLVFNALPRKYRTSGQEIKFFPYNRDKYDAICTVCSRVVPVIFYEDYTSVDKSNLIVVSNALLFCCSPECKDVYDINPLAYDLNVVFIEDISNARYR